MGWPLLLSACALLCCAAPAQARSSHAPTAELAAVQQGRQEEQVAHHQSSALSGPYQRQAFRQDAEDKNYCL